MTRKFKRYVAPFRTRLMAGILLCMFVLASSTRSHSDDNDLERLISEFYLLALDPEHGPAGGYVNKWVGEVRYTIEGKGHRRLLNEAITAQFGRLRDLTGLTYTPVNDATANFRILYLSVSERLELIQGIEERSKAVQDHLKKWNLAPYSPCTITFERKRGALVSADVYIKSEISMIVALWCIKAKISKVHGFVNDVEVADSIFGPPVASQDMTEKDRILFAVLYSDELKAGMPSEEAKRLLPELLSRERAK